MRSGDFIVVPLRWMLVLAAWAWPVVHVIAVAGGDMTEQTGRPRPIIFDTDPGGDDTLALLWLASLARQGHAQIVAVTTVAGNVNAEQTFTNAGRILKLAGYADVEIGRASGPSRLPFDAAHIHGSDGMGNLSASLPPSTHGFANARPASEIIIEKLKDRPGEITIVAVGPLANLAAAERESPGILAMAKEVVVMGGAFRHRGNITATAEFNIYCDPDAADVVFSSRSDIVVLPLDVTTHVTFTPEHAEAIRQAGTDGALGTFLVGLTRFLTQATLAYRDSEGVNGFHVHDATTLAYLYYPETLRFQRGRVHVETQGEHTRGQTILDERHGAKGPPNAWIALEVDAANLLTVLGEDLKALCREP